MYLCIQPSNSSLNLQPSSFNQSFVALWRTGFFVTALSRAFRASRMFGTQMHHLVGAHRSYRTRSEGTQLTQATQPPSPVGAHLLLLQALLIVLRCFCEGAMTGVEPRFFANTQNAHHAGVCVVTRQNVSGENIMNTHLSSPQTSVVIVVVAWVPMPALEQQGSRLLLLSPTCSSLSSRLTHLTHQLSLSSNNQSDKKATQSSRQSRGEAFGS